MKSKSVIITAPGKIEIREVDLPDLAPGQVLIKVRACAICTWEQRFYRGSAAEDYPFHGGHEVAGEVVELGSSAFCNAKVGDTVVVASMKRCGVCDSCRRSMDNFCINSDNQHKPGDLWGPGGFSEFMIVQDYEVYKANDDRDFAELALSEPVACVSRSVSTPQLSFGDSVLVQGAGIMGLIHVQLLKHRGVSVIVSEPDAARRNKAITIGADAALDPLSNDFSDSVKNLTQDRGFNAVFFTAGGGKAIEQVLPIITKRGWLCLYGSVHPKAFIQIDPNYIHYNEIFLTGTFSHTKDSFRQAVELLSQGIIDVKPFISERYPLYEVNKAFERAISPDTYRVILTCD